MFRELVDGDMIFKRTCIEKIDRLIRDDYLLLDLEQYLLFIFPMGDPNFASNFNVSDLFATNFFISNTKIIAKYFVPLIIHINGYNVSVLF